MEAEAEGEPGGGLIWNNPTAVWFDRIAAINGTTDSSSNGAGELGPDGLPRYKAEYIDPIAAIQADPKYASLRIANIIEIDSLPNLVTNTSGQPGGTVMCDTVKANGAYVNGVGYALARLGAIGMLIDTSPTAGAAPPGPPDRARRPAPTPTSTAAASTAGSTPATGATRPGPASASVRRPVRSRASTRTSG